MLICEFMCNFFLFKCCVINERLVMTVLKKRIDLNYVCRFSSYRAVNTLGLCYKTNLLMLYKEIIAVCSEIGTKHRDTLCGQNVAFVNVKPVGT
jgi:hypothetical protein